MPSTKVVTGAAALLAAAALVGTGAALSSAATGPPTPSSSTAPSRPGGAGHSHTAVTGDELAKVTAAVKAKDAGVAVTSVQQDPDGSYDVLGTKAGAEVRLEVSKDLTTVTTGPGRPAAGAPDGAPDTDPNGTGTGTSSSSTSAGAVAPV
jgi:hypothetical protein